MDFSFMKTGRSPVVNNNNTNDMLNMLELFTSNALKNSARFVELCNRNGVTEADVKYGLIYEVFEFFNRPNNLKELNEIEKLNEEEYDDEDDSDMEDIIVDDSEIDDFKRIEIDEIDNEEDKNFVVKLYNYYDNWDSWNPQTPLEQVLQNAVNKIK